MMMQSMLAKFTLHPDTCLTSPGRAQQSQLDDLVTPQVLPIYYLVELPLKGDSKVADGRIEQIYQKGRQSSLGLTEKVPRIYLLERIEGKKEYI